MCGIAGLASQSELNRLCNSRGNCDCGGTLRFTYDPPIMICLACGIRWEMPMQTHLAQVRDKIRELRREKFSPFLPPEEEPWVAELSVDLFEPRLE